MSPQSRYSSKIPEMKLEASKDIAGGQFPGVLWRKSIINDTKYGTWSCRLVKVYGLSRRVDRSWRWNAAGRSRSHARRRSCISLRRRCESSPLKQACVRSPRMDVMLTKLMKRSASWSPSSKSRESRGRTSESLGWIARGRPWLVAIWLSLDLLLVSL